METMNNRCAVIAIDLQNDYFHENGMMGKIAGTKNLQKMIPQLKTFIDNVRETKTTLVFFKMTEEEKAVPSNFKKIRDEIIGEGEWSLAVKGSWGHELIFSSQKDDKVFEKNNYDIFSNPEFNKYLQENEIKTLIILGGYTHVCVDTSVRSAFTKGFEMILAKDLVGSPDDSIEMHNSSLKVLTTLFAKGMESHSILKALKC